jgi:ketosteroid isomerase-like protein
MAENLNANAQSLNEATFDGDSVAGSSKDMRSLYAGGMTIRGSLRRRLRSAAIEAAENAVLAANERFYAAFEARDIDAMSSLWSHEDQVICTHPGWSTLRGWAAIASSWFALFQGPAAIQFILTDVHAVVVGEVAWVSLDENVIGRQLGSTVAALNVFVRSAGTWQMVAHHGSSVFERG